MIDVATGSRTTSYTSSSASVGDSPITPNTAIRRQRYSCSSYSRISASITGNTSA